MEDLEAFLAIVDEGGLGAASRALGIPKSTVSRRLERLEARLGTRLIHRTPRTVAPTDAGDRVIERVRQLLGDVDAVVERATEERGPRGRLRVSVPGDLAIHTAVWLGFMTAWPDVELDLAFSNRYVDLVAEGFDLALRAGPGDDDALFARRLGTYQLQAVAAPAYLRERGPLMRWTELLDADCVLLKAFRRDLGRERGRRHMVANDLHLVHAAAREGLGIAILPLELVADDLATGRLLAAVDEYDPLDVPLYAVYPDRRYLPTSVSAFIDHVAAHFGTAPPL